MWVGGGYCDFAQWVSLVGSPVKMSLNELYHTSSFMLPAVHPWPRCGQSRHVKGRPGGLHAAAEICGQRPVASAMLVNANSEICHFGFARPTSVV